MSNAQKALVMAAGIFLAIALITLAVVLFISAQDSTKAAQSNFSNIQTELSQTAFTVYDNTTLSGSQVVNALRKFSDQEQFGIQIITGKNPTGQWYGKVINIGVPMDSIIIRFQSSFISPVKVLSQGLADHSGTKLGRTRKTIHSTFITSSLKWILTFQSFFQ
ncbi:ABC transporter permease [Xylanibacillus composti]|uniref:ABC transporter permease n=1 Tax=Xylanibacillus composti TaxID=1572762 RepID=A0A8J4H3L3_9BACL|nr:ABC transporter permease [Xylanibacillus composti]GIQ68921.1 hypothetical protein XYCOK13_17450 [Xylanibacillus composti]